MNRQIVVSMDGLPAAALRRIEETAARAGAAVVFLPESDRWQHFPAAAEVAFGLPPASVIESSQFRFVQLQSAGYDTYRTPQLLQRQQFAIANARGIMSHAVAEHCLSMMFAFSRGTLVHAEHQRQRLWQRAGRYELLHGSTLTIVGTGAIGSALGLMCHCLGMRVLAVQRSPEQPAWASAVYPFEQLHDALAQSRHLALVLPGLPGPPLIGASELQAMPAGSYVYNVGRAAALDYGALSAALKSGALAGAGLDVFPTEPLSPDDPLWRRPDVIVSPHAAGRYVEEMATLAELFIDNLQRYLTGRPLRNVVIGGAEPER